MTADLSCENVSLTYGNGPVIEDLSVDLVRGAITVIVGPNASGKSSLLRCLCRLQKPTHGRVLLDGQPIDSFSTREVAQRLAFLPQNTVAPRGMRVNELVLRGRTPYQSPLRQFTPEDQDIAAQAIAHVGLSAQADALLETLSGGQLQRAWIAMILAQDTDILILDEPTTYLDLAHQREILELVRTLQRQRGLTVAMVLHDINLAARYADHILALKDRGLAAAGPPETVVTEDNIARIFGLACSVIEDPFNGTPHIILK